jgi:Domain of unknown function (DUF4832)/Domain of unknown function (DUF4874)
MFLPRILGLLAVVALFASTGSAQETEAVPMTGRAFTTSEADLPNPERGFYKWIDIVNGRDFRYLRDQGVMLGFCSLSLAPWRNSELPQDYLDRLNAGFDGVRRSGIKTIVRFKYADWQGDEDASKERILGHIAQLKPVLQANGDVIAILQAGFIGAWGEWHTSTHGLDNPADRGDILRALLGVMPPERFLQVRTPEFKESILGCNPLSGDEGWCCSARARVGHHNDAFLGSWNDRGTYDDPVDAQKNYVSAESRYVPVGGECNTVNPPQTEGWNAVQEMMRFRYSFLSGEYKQAVLDGWTGEGYLPEIRKHLGYRISLMDAAWNASVKPGGILQFSLHLRNSGYAAPFNARPLYVVLSSDGAWHAARIDSTDVRRWDGGQDVWVNMKLRVPGTLAKGRYRLSLWLPDAALSLQYRSEYAIQLADAGTWDAASGYNRVTDSLSVDPDAPGSVNPSATTFQELR